MRISRFNENFEDSPRRLKIEDRSNSIKLASQISKKLKLGSTKFLGSGDRGMSFDCENKVLKLTSDIEEINFYLKSRSSHTKHVVDVYHIHKLHSLMGGEMYSVVMEKVNILTDFESEVITTSFATFVYWENLNGNEFFEDWIYDELDNWIEKKFPNNFNEAKSVMIDYSNLCKEVERLGGSTEECHSRNLGYDDNGIMKCFDITMRKYNPLINSLPILTLY